LENVKPVAAWSQLARTVRQSIVIQSGERK